jgi:hypothetical protein
MQLQVRLVHAEPGARVVAVTALQDGRPLTSALGEGTTAEEAEDRARQRLQRLLAAPVPRSEAPAAPTADRVRAAAPAKEPEPGAPPPPEEPEADPEDWSAELARVDLQLQRLGWQRTEERAYLERAFGHPSRGRITTYADLLAYLQALEGFPSGSDPAAVPVPLRRRDLLEQCDALLEQLGWDAGRGRRRLEQEFGCNSRQQLSDAQLLHFNMLLEEELLAATRSAPAPEAG